MSKKKKAERQPVITTVGEAIEFYDNYDEKVDRLKSVRTKARIIPISFFLILSFLLMIFENQKWFNNSVTATLFLLSFPVMAIVFYIKSGVDIGSILSTVLGKAKKIAFWGWFLIPIFPIDLIIGLYVLLFAIVYTIVALIFLPSIPISLKIKDMKLDYKDAIDILYENGIVDINGQRIDDNSEECSSIQVESGVTSVSTTSELSEPKLEPPKKSSMKIIEHTKKKCPNCSQAVLNVISNGTVKAYMCPSCKKKYRYKEA